MSIARADWPRLLDLVEQALDQPAEARPAWLQALALPAPLHTALLGLLEERRAIETGDFLAALPTVLPAEPAAGRFAPGSLVGPWRLLRELGQGGMSTVWLAERADAQLTRQVALKLPHAGPGQDLLAARLLRERNILAALEHPNIARLYDVGLTDAGTPYLVMEYVAGDTLLAHADRLKLTIAQRLALFQQVLRAVQYAHGKLVLHRDLKPSNILVNEAGDVKLLDFGIAKPLADAGRTHDDTELTRSAGRQLTPAYASPEQLRGEALGTASDVYALGVVLHELLCGERPFAQHLARQTAGRHHSALRLEDAVLHRDAPAPSRLNPEAPALAARRCTLPQWRKALAGDLDAIVLHSLGKTPAERYATVDRLAADVAHWLAQEPVSVTTPSTWYHLRKFVGRHRLGVALGSTVAGLLLLSSTLAVLQSLRAGEEARRANASRDFLLGIFEDTDPNTSTGRELPAKELLERSRAKLLRAGARDSALPTTTLLMELASAQRRLGDSTGALATMEQLLAALPPQAGQQRLDTLQDLTEASINQNRNPAARDYLRQVLAEMQRQGLLQDRTRLRQLAYLSGRVAMYDARQATVAAQALRGYFDLAEQPDAAPLEDRLWARTNLAKAESLSGHLPAALAQLDLARQLAHAHPDALPDTRYRPLASFAANIDNDWGRYAQVVHWLPPVIERCVRERGPAHDDCLDLRGHLIRAQLKRGDVADALVQSRHLQAQADNAASPRRRFEAAVLMARATAWAGWGQPQAAEPSAHQVRQPPDLALLQTLLQPGQPEPPPAASRLLMLNTLAETHLLAGRPDAALAWLAQARQLQSSAGLPGQARESLKTALFSGLALQARGQHAQALAELAPYCDEAGLAAARQTALLDRLFSLNCVPSLRQQGRLDEAQRLVDAALPVLAEGLGENSPTLRRARQLQDPAVPPPAGRPQATPPPRALPSIGFFS